MSFTKSLPTWEAGTPVGMTEPLPDEVGDGLGVGLLVVGGVEDGLEGGVTGVVVELGDGLGLQW
ncbi:MAG TPA: hypothetical protein VEV61_09120 [Streptosporangiaceae bacterium]|nr:hypothetical protein [Streptosporangiaceae bacterium]